MAIKKYAKDTERGLDCNPMLLRYCKKEKSKMKEILSKQKNRKL